MSEWAAIVLDIDGGERLDRCLRSIGDQSPGPARVVIVDNGSMVPVRERIEDDGGRRIVRSERNLGFTGGVNLGWPETSEPFVALINNDVELEAGWAEAMMDAFDRDPRLGAVQSIIMTPQGRVDGAGIAIGTGRFLQLGHGETLESLQVTPWGVSATATLYRRAALEDVAIDGRLLHPAFFAYYEDVELSARLLEAGWSSSVVPRPLVVHEGSRSAARLGLRADYLRTRNRYFVRRLHPGVGRLGALIAEDVSKIARALAALEPRRAAAIVGGVVAGCFARIAKGSR